MERYLGRFSEPIYALTRFVTGFLFFWHGAQKLFGVLGGNAAEAFTLIWVAGVIEFFGGLLVAVGLLTGWAAFLCSGQMAVAYFMAHHDPEALLPIQNKGELAALYCWVFLFIAARGSGIWSVDAARGGGSGAS
jgi:putative oxidoreductase